MNFQSDRERPLLEALKTVVDEARTEPAPAHRVLAFQANAHLDALGEPVPSENTARYLLEALDRGALDSLKDDDGIDCRRRAVELLLRRGYPDALKLRPEDVDYFQRRRRRGRGRRLGRLNHQLAPTLIVLAGIVETVWGLHRLIFGLRDLFPQELAPAWIAGILALQGAFVALLPLVGSSDRHPRRGRFILISVLLGLVVLAVTG